MDIKWSNKKDGIEKVQNKYDSPTKFNAFPFTSPWNLHFSSLFSAKLLFFSFLFSFRFHHSVSMFRLQRLEKSFANLLVTSWVIELLPVCRLVWSSAEGKPYNGRPCRAWCTSARPRNLEMQDIPPPRKCLECLDSLLDLMLAYSSLTAALPFSGHRQKTQNAAGSQ